MLTHALTSAVANLVILAALPLLGYFVVLRWRTDLSGREILARAGLQTGDARVLWICAALSVVVVAALLVFPPSVESFTREGSAQRIFLGGGLGAETLAAVLLYGVVQTGFSEELLFRGLITGALARRLSDVTANVVQALIFLVPHLLILFVVPEAWPVLVIVFAGALFTGWARIESGSILGPWLLHAAANVTVALSIAIRSGG